MSNEEQKPINVHRLSIKQSSSSKLTPRIALKIQAESYLSNYKSSSKFTFLRA